VSGRRTCGSGATTSKQQCLAALDRLATWLKELVGAKREPSVVVVAVVVFIGGDRGSDGGERFVQFASIVEFVFIKVVVGAWGDVARGECDGCGDDEERSRGGGMRTRPGRGDAAPDVDGEIVGAEEFSVRAGRVERKLGSKEAVRLRIDVEDVKWHRDRALLAECEVDGDTSCVGEERQLDHLAFERGNEPTAAHCSCWSSS
jgi:hypothetical protein